MKKTMVSIVSVEKEYVNNIMTCLRNNQSGRLSPTELFVLDKIREALNIPKEKAHKLLQETLLNFSMKRNLFIYRDAVAACLLDSGYLTSTERFLLDRLRIALCLPDSVAYQLEKKIDWDL